MGLVYMLMFFALTIIGIILLDAFYVNRKNGRIRLMLMLVMLALACASSSLCLLALELEATDKGIDRFINSYNGHIRSFHNIGPLQALPREEPPQGPRPQSH